MKKISNKDVDDALIGCNIKRLDNVVNASIKIRWQCLVPDCFYIWEAKPSQIKSRKTGCPSCNKGLPLNNENVDFRLENRNIKRLDDVVNSSTKISWLCLNECCGYIWITTPNHIIHNLKGCPKCGGSYPLNNDEVDKRLLGRNIKRIGLYKNKDTKIDFQCLDCGNIWKATPSHVLSKCGCPICNVAGVNEKRILSCLRANNIEFNYDYNLYNLGNVENKRLRVDFYIKSSNLIIEYNGEQHYVPRKFGSKMTDEEAHQQLFKQQARDKYVNDFCLNNKIQIIWIDGRKYYGQKLIDYFNKEILPLLNQTIS